MLLPMCTYQGARNVSFSEYFAYVINGWFPDVIKVAQIKIGFYNVIFL